MFIDTISNNLTKALTANSSATSFAAKVITTTEPTGTGIIDLRYPGRFLGHAKLRLHPYGTGNDDTTFAMRMIGWTYATSGDPDTAVWVPTVLAEVACTLSTAVGVAAKYVIETERFCDTITKVTGNDEHLRLVSPTGNVIGYVELYCSGVHKVELSFDMTGATDGNCLYALL